RPPRDARFAVPGTAYDGQLAVVRQRLAGLLVLHRALDGEGHLGRGRRRRGEGDVLDAGVLRVAGEQRGRGLRVVGERGGLAHPALLPGGEETLGRAGDLGGEIGRASCRERVEL